MTKVRKQFLIDDDLNDGLRMVAARTGRSEAEHVRAALWEYLRQVRPHTASSAGIWSRSPTPAIGW
jgi:plasmid stability protein